MKRSGMIFMCFDRMRLTAIPIRTAVTIRRCIGRRETGLDLSDSLIDQGIASATIRLLKINRYKEWMPDFDLASGWDSMRMSCCQTPSKRSRNHRCVSELACEQCDDDDDEEEEEEEGRGRRRSQCETTSERKRTEIKTTERIRQQVCSLFWHPIPLDQ